MAEEYNYLIRCDYFLHERQLFINKYYKQHPSDNTLFYKTHADRELHKQS